MSMKQIYHSQRLPLGIFGIVSRFSHTLLSFLWQPMTYQLSIFGALHPSPLSHTRDPTLFTSLMVYVSEVTRNHGPQT